MKKCLITEISEEDFRKLDLKVHRYEKVIISENIPGHPVVQNKMIEYSLNDILDKEIKLTLNAGYDHDLEDLKTPVTIAIHTEPEDADEFVPSFIKTCYLDKFMNSFTGPQTYQFAWGIEHLYSTRDYFESHSGDYWRVSKKETKVIYRIHLDEKWINNFKIKHISKKVKQINETEWIETCYDLDEKSGKYVPSHSVYVFKDNKRTTFLPHELTLPEEDKN